MSLWRNQKEVSKMNDLRDSFATVSDKASKAQESTEKLVCLKPEPESDTLSQQAVLNGLREAMGLPPEKHRFSLLDYLVRAVGLAR